MEAASNQQAALRLAATAAGVLLTLVMVFATLGHRSSPHAEPSQYDAGALPVLWAPPQPVIERPTTCEPSYQLPEEMLEVLPATDEESNEVAIEEDLINPDEALSGPVFAVNSTPATAGEETSPVEEESPEAEDIAALPEDDHFNFDDIFAEAPLEEAEVDVAGSTETLNNVITDASTEAVLAEELPPPPIVVTLTTPTPEILPRPQDIEAYTPALAGLDARLRTEVRKGFDLGRAGALFAARAKFIGVMRKIALAKDAEEGTNRHAHALAEGLRALDEADDFVPRGDALEAELDTTAIAASHVTPIVRESDEAFDPHAAVTLYSQYAAKQLGEAVAGAQAGSMACYGLGKTYARLEAQSEDPHAGRKSGVMHRAALAAHPANYMAANELGVRLASLGHYEQARNVLRHAVAQNAPISKIHENLAMVEQKLGNTSGAMVAQGTAQTIAQHERTTGELSRRNGVQWVAPQSFQKPGQQAPQQAAPQQVAATPPPNHALAAEPTMAPTPLGARVQTKNEGGWKNTFSRLRRATGWSAEQAAPATPAPADPSAQRPFAPTVGYGSPSVAHSYQRVLR